MTTPFVDDLTPQQFAVAEFIDEFRGAHDGISPTYAEIAEGVGVCHRSNVRQKVLRLIAKGYIEAAAGVSRSFRTTRKWDLRKRRRFGMAANPLVMQVVLEHPDVFTGWNAERFDSLLSRRAFGGELTPDGVLHEARKLNENDLALDDCRELLEVDDAREVILKTLEQLKQQHRPRKRGRKSEIRNAKSEGNPKPK